MVVAVVEVEEWLRGGGMEEGGEELLTICGGSGGCWRGRLGARVLFGAADDSGGEVVICDVGVR